MTFDWLETIDLGRDGSCASTSTAPRSPRRRRNVSLDQSTFQVILALIALVILAKSSTHLHLSISNHLSEPKLATHATVNAPTKGKLSRAFVCVTGQVGQLELTTKFTNVFAPLLEHFDGVDVAVVIYNETRISSKVQFENISKPENSFDLSELRAAANALDAGARINVREFLEKRPTTPTTTHAFQMSKECSQASLSVNEKAQCLRSAEENVMRLFTLAACHDALLGYSLGSLRGLRSPTYTLVGHIRGDAAIPTRIDVVGVLQRALQSSTLVAPACERGQGVNNKMTFASTTHASNFFTAPLRVYYGASVDWSSFQESGDNNSMESFLLHAYTTSGLRPTFDRSLRPLHGPVVHHGYGRYEILTPINQSKPTLPCFDEEGFVLKSDSAAQLDQNCRDVEGYKDSKGLTCAVYAQREWCSPNLRTGPRWDPRRGSLWELSRSADGVPAPLACCLCGGGRPMPTAHGDNKKVVALVEESEGGVMI